MPRIYTLISSLSLAACICLAGLQAQEAPTSDGVTTGTLIEAEKLFGISFSDEEREAMLPGLQSRVPRYEGVRTVPLSNSIPSALIFDPIPVGAKFETVQNDPRWTPPEEVALPEDMDDLAFYSVGELAALIRTRQISSEKLTSFYLDRLKKYGPKLECVVTLTEELALGQARRADREIAAGNYRGPLHGIPYGAKDLLATKDIPTTWGSPT